MKVTCHNCGKRFDYDTYTGLCPKCSTYYRIDSAYDTTADTYDHSETDDDLYDDEEDDFDASLNEDPSKTSYDCEQGKTAGLHTSLQSDTGSVRSGAFKKNRKLTSFLLVLIALAFIVPYVATQYIIHARQEENSLSQVVVPVPASMGEPMSFEMEDNYRYELTIQSASVVTDTCYQIPNGYQLIGFSYTLTEPDAATEDISDSNRLSRSLGYDDITPYLYTHSGEYLQAIDAYDIAKAQGDKDYEWRLTTGTSSDFEYAKGTVYFLVKEGDIANLLIQHTNYESTTLLESYQIDQLEVTE
ncbi:MAG: hypothetical protein J6A03_05810 [Lachnospiraceae bacterium]|nr:hypothetical protein [Lachnospiraceae bacterium]